MSLERTTRSHERNPVRRRPQLHYRSGDQEFELPIEQPLTIGNSLHAGQFANVALSDDEVSRLHAELDPRPEGVWIRDLGSTNGTFVNEEQIVARQPLTLHTGDRVRVGRTTFTLELPEVPTHTSSSGRVGAMVLQADGTTTVNLTLK